MARKRNFREAQILERGSEFNRRQTLPPNLYKLVKNYAVQPHPSMEWERGLSAQNRSKTPARNGLPWSHRKEGGADLTKPDKTLREAATALDNIEHSTVRLSIIVSTYWPSSTRIEHSHTSTTATSHAWYSRSTSRTSSITTAAVSNTCIRATAAAVTFV